MVETQLPICNIYSNTITNAPRDNCSDVRRYSSPPSSVVISMQYTVTDHSFKSLTNVFCACSQPTALDPLSRVVIYCYRVSKKWRPLLYNDALRIHWIWTPFTKIAILWISHILYAYVLNIDLKLDQVIALIIIANIEGLYVVFSNGTIWLEHC